MAGATDSMIDTMQSKEVAGKTIGVQSSNPILCIESASLNDWILLISYSAPWFIRSAARSRVRVRASGL